MTREARLEAALRAVMDDLDGYAHHPDTCGRCEECDDGDCGNHDVCPPCECGFARTQVLVAAARAVLAEPVGPDVEVARLRAALQCFVDAINAGRAQGVALSAAEEVAKATLAGSGTPYVRPWAERMAALESLRRRVTGAIAARVGDDGTCWDTMAELQAIVTDAGMAVPLVEAAPAVEHEGHPDTCPACDAHGTGRKP